MKTDRISFYINRKGDRDLYVIDLEQNRNIIVYSENRRELELFVKGLRPSCSVLVLERDEIKNQLIGIGLGENKAIENERLYIIKEEDVFATCSWKALTDLIQSDHRMMILTNTPATFTELTSQRYRECFSLCFLFKAPHLFGKLVFTESDKKPSPTSLNGKGEFFSYSWRSNNLERLSIDYHEKEISNAERKEREFLDSSIGYAKEIAYKTVLLVKELRRVGFLVGCRGRMNWSAFYMKEGILGHGAQQELQDYFSTSLRVNRKYPLSELELSGKALEYIRKHYPEDVHSYYEEDGSWILSNAIILHPLKDYDDYEGWEEESNTVKKAADKISTFDIANPDNYFDVLSVQGKKQQTELLLGYDKEIDRILCKEGLGALVYYEQLLQILLLFCDMESLALREKRMRLKDKDTLGDIRRMFLASNLARRMPERQREPFLTKLFDAIAKLEKKSNIMDSAWIRMKMGRMGTSPSDQSLLSLLQFVQPLPFEFLLLK